jgi:hypothetical protein
MNTLKRPAALGIATLALLGAVGGITAAASASSSTLPTSKQQIEGNWANAAAAADAARRALPQSIAQQKAAIRPPAAPQAGDVPVRVSQIVAAHVGPYSPTVFSTNDLWEGSDGAGHWVLVYAGAARDDSGNGAGAAVRVYTEPVSPTDPGDLTFVGQFAAGAGDIASIASVSGHVLTLTTADGHTLHFDAQSDSFS